MAPVGDGSEEVLRCSEAGGGECGNEENEEEERNADGMCSSDRERLVSASSIITGRFRDDTI